MVFLKALSSSQYFSSCTVHYVFYPFAITTTFMLTECTTYSTILTLDVNKLNLQKYYRLHQMYKFV